MSKQALYPIREVSSITGVNSITLRAWERRYGLIEPVRTDGGHRLYTEEHINRIKAAVKLSKQGVAISQVKTILESQPATANEQMDAPQGFESRLVEYALSFEIKDLHSELDQLFSDQTESVCYEILFNVSNKLLSESDLSFSFWQSELNSRLQARLRSAKQNLRKSLINSIWLESMAGVNQVFRSIFALQLCNQGFYPIINSETFLADDSYQGLLETLQQIECENLAVLGRGRKFSESFWNEWQSNNPAIALHYFQMSS